MEYTVEYFINKFEAIPTQEIGSVSLINHCALWHCGLQQNEYKHTDESRALVRIFGGDCESPKDAGEMGAIYRINDGIGDNKLLGNTPKERILNKLYQIRDGK